MGRWDCIEDDHFIQHYSTLKRIHKDFQTKPPDLTPPPGKWRGVGIWYYGDTHTGKSYAARQEFPGAFIKSAKNKWWCGYRGEEYVILDDMDKSHEYMGFDLKIWADVYAFPAENKGGAEFIRPLKIIVTSNYHPKDIWTDPSMLNPILDRFKITRFLRPFELHFPHAAEQDETRCAYAPGFAPPVMPTTIPAGPAETELSLEDLHDFNFDDTIDLSFI